MLKISKDKNRNITVFRFWILEIIVQESENCYMGNWKFGKDLVGSFTKIKIQKEVK